MCEGNETHGAEDAAQFDVRHAFRHAQQLFQATLQNGPVNGSIQLSIPGYEHPPSPSCSTGDYSRPTSDPPLQLLLPGSVPFFSSPIWRSPSVISSSLHSS